MTDYRTKIEAEEGRKNKLYKCSLGHVTGGIGHNFDANGLSDAVIDLIYDEDEAIAIKDAKGLVSDFYALPDNVKLVLVDMAFQMGKSRLRLFKNMFQAIEVEAWDVAAIELLDSRYARQTPNRANRNAELMKKG